MLVRRQRRARLPAVERIGLARSPAGRQNRPAGCGAGVCDARVNKQPLVSCSVSTGPIGEVTLGKLSHLTVLMISHRRGSDSAVRRGSVSDVSDTLSGDFDACTIAKRSISAQRIVPAAYCSYREQP